MTDIFILHKIEILYYFIFLGLFHLSYNYIIYSLKFKLESDIQKLEKKYTEVWVLFAEESMYDIQKSNYHDTYVSIREYIQIQIKAAFEDVTYKGIPMTQKFLLEQYKKTNNVIELTDFHYEQLEKDFYENIPQIINLTNYLECNLLTPKMFFIPQIKLTLYVLYLMCWSLILGVSMYVFPPDFEYTLHYLYTMLKYLEMENPFY